MTACPGQEQTPGKRTGNMKAFSSHTMVNAIAIMNDAM
jgi:hypothetical protein